MSLLWRQTMRLNLIKLAKDLQHFLVQDDKGRDFLLGVSYMGISVKDVNGRPSVYFRWSDIVNLTQNKRVFGINGMGSNRTIEFYLDDSEIAKYVFRMCSLQHQFYKATHNLANNSVQTTNDNNQENNTPDIQKNIPTPTTPVQPTEEILHTTPSGLSEFGSPQSALTDDSTFDGPQTYEVVHNNTPVQQNGTPYIPPVQHAPVDNLPINPPTQSSHLPASASLGNLAVRRTSAASDHAPAPAYRPAPDYNVVMQQRLQQQQQQQQQQQSNHMDQVMLTNLANLGHSQVYNNPEMMAYSQPEIGSTPPSYSQHMSQSGLHMTTIGTDYNQPSTTYYPGRPVDRTSSLIIHPTYSTPDLQNMYSTSNKRLNTDLLLYPSQPPVYAPPTRSSSSYPDLASQNLRSMQSTSPDLVSHHGNATLQDNPNLLAQSRFDQGVENLTLDAQLLSLNQAARQVVDDTSSTQSEYVIHNSCYNGSMPDVTANNLPNTQPQLREVFIVDPPQCTTDASSQLSQQQQMLQLLQREKEENQRKQELLDQQQQLLLQSALSASESLLSPSSEDTMIIHSPEPETPSTPAFLNPENLDTLNMSPEQLDYSSSGSVEYVSPSQFIGTDYPMDNDSSEGISSINSPASSTIPYEGESFVSCGSSEVQRRDTEAGSHRSVSSSASSQPEDVADKRLSVGPMKMAALNGLTLSRGSVLDQLTTPPEDSRVPKDERRKAMENKIEEGQVFVEFEQIPKKRQRYELAVSSHPQNKERNRFKDVLPYDDNRVKLTPSKTNPQGYINASHLRMKVAGQDWWYIAAQGPLPDTTRDFWQMIWEQEVEVVAMLTGVTEHGRTKCQKYWPDVKGPKNAMKFGDYQVSLKFCNKSGPYVTNGLILHNKRLKRERLIWHLQYTDWPDHGCPDDPVPFLDYLNEIEAVRRRRQLEKRETQAIPVLVHCSAGVGRTGVTILTELMKACFEYNEVADIPEVLFRLREQRMYMVQTVSQYSFVYQTLVEYLRGSRLI